MKPKHFKAPFTFDDRKVLIRDQIMTVPDNYSDWGSFTFPGWESEEIFGNSNPIHIEYCTGNGTWIAQKAQENPQINWVAVEKRYDRVAKIWSKIQNQGLKNLFCIWGEGHAATREYFPDASIATVYVNFPDPWPKKRHHKHRLMKPEFIEQMHRILVPEGTFTFVTDDTTYSELATAELQASAGFGALHADPFYITDLPGYGTSYFDSLWRGHGKEIRYHQYKRQAVETPALTS